MLRSESALPRLTFWPLRRAVDMGDADGVNHSPECLHLYQITWGLMRDLVSHLGLRLQQDEHVAVFPKPAHEPVETWRKDGLQKQVADHHAGDV